MLWMTISRRDKPLYATPNTADFGFHPACSLAHVHYLRERFLPSVSLFLSRMKDQNPFFNIKNIFLLVVRFNPERVQRGPSRLALHFMLHHDFFSTAHHDARTLKWISMLEIKVMSGPLVSGGVQLVRFDKVSGMSLTIWIGDHHSSLFNEQYMEQSTPEVRHLTEPTNKNWETCPQAIQDDTAPLCSCDQMEVMSMIWIYLRVSK